MRESLSDEESGEESGYSQARIGAVTSLQKTPRHSVSSLLTSSLGPLIGAPGLALAGFVLALVLPVALVYGVVSGYVPLVAGEHYSNVENKLPPHLFDPDQPPFEAAPRELTRATD